MQNNAVKYPYRDDYMIWRLFKPLRFDRKIRVRTAWIESSRNGKRTQRAKSENCGKSSIEASIQYPYKIYAK